MIHNCKKQIKYALALIKLFPESFSGLFSGHETVRIRFFNMWDKYPGSMRNGWLFNFIKHTLQKEVKINILVQDISVFSVFGRRNFKKGGGCKIFITGENVHSFEKPQYRQYGDLGIDDVDLSIGFDFADNSKYQRFPLWILYFFKPDSEKDDIAAVVRKFNDIQYPKNKFCCIVARQDFNNIRKSIYDKVSAIAKVDAGGRLFYNDDSLKNKYKDNKEEYLKQYKFNICPENSCYNGYITEKIFQSFYSGCIPVYRGPEKIEEGIVNPNWIIRWNDNDCESSLQLIQELHTSSAAYSEYLKQPKLLDSAVDLIWDYFENLKEKLLIAVGQSG